MSKCVEQCEICDSALHAAPITYPSRNCTLHVLKDEIREYKLFYVFHIARWVSIMLLVQ